MGWRRDRNKDKNTSQSIQMLRSKQRARQDSLIQNWYESILLDFLTMDVAEVFDVFIQMEDSVVGTGFCYVPGYMPWDRRVLLVAHADTVRKSPPDREDIKVQNGTFTSLTDAPIGADDRAGCAALFLLSGLGHSLLITDDEEVGCLGARSAARSIGGQLAEHAFAVEVDRRGNDEAVFYDSTGNAEFADYIKNNFPGYRLGRGSVTDISSICAEIDICGVNFATGYRNEHTKDEKLNVLDWMKTLKLLKRLLTEAEIIDPGPPDRKWSPYNKITKWGNKTHNASVKPAPVQQKIQQPKKDQKHLTQLKESIYNKEQQVQNTLKRAADEEREQESLPEIKLVESKKTAKHVKSKTDYSHPGAVPLEMITYDDLCSNDNFWRRIWDRMPGESTDHYTQRTAAYSMIVTGQDYRTLYDDQQSLLLLSEFEDTDDIPMVKVVNKAGDVIGHIEAYKVPQENWILGFIEVDQVPKGAYN